VEGVAATTEATGALAATGKELGAAAGWASEAGAPTGALADSKAAWAEASSCDCNEVSSLSVRRASASASEADGCAKEMLLHSGELSGGSVSVQSVWLATQ